MTVYVPQEVLYLNNKRELVPKFNIHAAEEYGNIVVMLPYTNVSMAPQDMVIKLRHQLKDFSDDDYILPMGDPIAIGASIAIASTVNNGRIKLLKWRGKNGHCYIELKMNLRGNHYD